MLFVLRGLFLSLYGCPPAEPYSVSNQTVQTKRSIAIFTNCPKNGKPTEAYKSNFCFLIGDCLLDFCAEYGTNRVGCETHRGIRNAQIRPARGQIGSQC